MKRQGTTRKEAVNLDHLRGQIRRLSSHSGATALRLEINTLRLDSPRTPSVRLARFQLYQGVFKAKIAYNSWVINEEEGTESAQNANIACAQEAMAHFAAAYKTLLTLSTIPVTPEVIKLRRECQYEAAATMTLLLSWGEAPDIMLGTTDLSGNLSKQAARALRFKDVMLSEYWEAH